MLIGWRWLVWSSLLLVLCTSCDRLQSNAVAAPAVGAVAANREKFTEAVPLKAPGLGNLRGVSISVASGDIDVIAVEVNGNSTRIMGLVLEDELPLGQDMTDSVVTEQRADGDWLVVRVNDAQGVNGPHTTTRVRVPEGVHLELKADKGNINVAGNVSTVRAEANGAIEVRGSTRGLVLKSTGKGHILAVGGTGLIDLRADEGYIDLMADSALVNAVTGSGDIRFEGTLAAGTSYFTSTIAGNLELITPSSMTYRLKAVTRNNRIDVEAPSRAQSAWTTVCGVTDYTWPIRMKLDYNVNRGRTHVGINAGEGASASDIWATALVTSLHVEFRTNAHVFTVYVDDPSDAGIDMDDPPLTGTALPAAAQQIAAPPAAPTLSPARTDPTLQALARTDPTLQAAIAANPQLQAEFEGFAGGAIAAAPAPAAQSQQVAPATTVAAAASVGIPGNFGETLSMRGENCRLPADTPGGSSVLVSLFSNNGRINLLQVAPEVP